MMNTLLNKNKEKNQILEALPNILTLMTGHSNDIGH